MSSALWKSLFIAITSVFICSGLVFADDTSSNDTWYYEITPYVSVPAIDGNSTLNGQTVGVDLDQGDVLGALDMAFSIRGELWKDEWGLILDWYYANLGEAEENQLVALDVDIRQSILDTLVGYSVLGQHKAGPRPEWIFDLMGGIRWNYLKQTGTLTTTQPNLPNPSLGQSEYFADLFLGARVGAALNEWLTLIVRGGAGGFGIGSSSDLNWEILGGFDAAFHRRWSARLGWRHYDLDYSTGSGRDAFGLDGTMSGPYLAVSYRGDFS